MTYSDPIRLRTPILGDGAAVHELIRSSPPLDENSRYSYFLLCSHFRDTCCLAETEGGIAGFLSAYLVPDRADTLFIWQIAVASSMRGHRLAGRMLERVASGAACAGIRYLETTISTSNTASRRVFDRFAESRGARLREETFLEAHHFGDESHEDERLIRIGPWAPKITQKGAES